ncbi:hypothetical protein BFP70_15530 [Thioclava sp. SK-1]|uniref:hypothetical protein n=1 Tax=Thioclava sp. SK-1 TaxID=1889770 RepID=UPI00082690B7|nr:hypothetical protein [Thioclava sp. SK-1]OCX61452.1 hypothetical protein BFP70_15530 [Thioclava sp. SK-1]
MIRLKAVLLLIATIAFLASPFWAQSFRGYDPQNFPVQITDPAIQPAGWAFSIWGVIYLWLLGHAVMSTFKRSDAPDWDAPRWGMICSLGLGASWLQVAMVAPVLATVQIWLMAGFALWALSKTGQAKPTKHARFALLSGPIGLYAGWVTAATGVATGVVLIGYGIGSETAVSLTMLCVIAAVALTVTARMNPPVTYPIGVIWALIGVIAANWGRDLIMLPAAIFALALLALVLRPFLPRSTV